MSSSSAATSASGTNRPPKTAEVPGGVGPARPRRHETVLGRMQRAGRHAQRQCLPAPPPLAGSRRAGGVLQRRGARGGRVRARGDQVGDGLARVAGGDQPLADEHGVGAGGGVGDEVVRPAHAGLGDLDHSRGQPGRDPLEGRAVDLQRGQVAGVDPDHRGAGGQRPVGLGLGVHLDERRHAERLGPLEQAGQRVLLQRGDDEQHDVGTVRAGLVHLVAGDDEVLAQHGDVDGGPDGGQVGLRAAEAAPLGEHADHPRAAGGVLRGRARPGRGCRPARPWTGSAA